MPDPSRQALPARIGLCPVHAVEFYMPLDEGEDSRCPECSQPMRVYSLEEGQKITHGRHCTCSACAREDWADPEIAPCGMHGGTCPRSYQPWGLAGTYV